MIADRRKVQDPSITSLLGDVMADARELLKQQAAMFLAECRIDWQEAKKSAIALALAVGLLAEGGILMGFTLVHVLYWAASPEYYQPGLPLWVSYGIVSGASIGIGAALLAWAVRRFREQSPVPHKTVAALQENIQWLMNRK